MHTKGNPVKVTLHGFIFTELSAQVMFALLCNQKALPLGAAVILALVTLVVGMLVFVHSRLPAT